MNSLLLQELQEMQEQYTRNYNYPQTVDALPKANWDHTVDPHRASGITLLELIDHRIDLALKHFNKI